MGFASYSSRTGGSIDYVLLWSVEASPPNHPALMSLRQQLAGYELIYVSPNKLAQLYRRKGLAKGVIGGSTIQIP